MFLFLELNKDLDVDMFYIEEMKGHQVLCQMDSFDLFQMNCLQREEGIYNFSAL